MFASERQQQIVGLLQADGSVRTTALAARFEVAEETIRRDLEQLSRRGLLTRTHGGGTDPARRRPEAAHDERERRQVREKRRIAQAAAAVIQSGDSVLLDASSTALEMVPVLPPEIRVVTYSLAMVERLSHRSDLEVVQLGGVFEARGRRFGGLLTEAALRSLRIDRFFFSGGSFDPVQGVSEPNREQASIKRLGLGLARWSGVLLDHSKLGVPGDWYFAAPEDFQLLVTDAAGEVFFEPFETAFEVRIAS